MTWKLTAFELNSKICLPIQNYQIRICVGLIYVGPIRDSMNRIIINGLVGMLFCSFVFKFSFLVEVKLGKELFYLILFVGFLAGSISTFIFQKFIQVGTLRYLSAYRFVLIGLVIGFLVWGLMPILSIVLFSLLTQNAGGGFEAFALTIIFSPIGIIHGALIGLFEHRYAGV